MDFIPLVAEALGKLAEDTVAVTRAMGRAIAAERAPLTSPPPPDNTLPSPCGGATPACGPTLPPTLDSVARGGLQITDYVIKKKG